MLESSKESTGQSGSRNSGQATASRLSDVSEKGAQSESHYKDTLPPWHPERDRLMIGEVGPYLKHFYGRGVSQATVYRWMKHGAWSYELQKKVFLKRSPFMGRTYVKKVDLIAFLEARG